MEMDRIAVEHVACALAAHEDYRILRRLDLPSGPTGAETVGRTRVGLAVDCETTGLDTRAAKIIELAMRPFVFDRRGIIVDVGESASWLADPGEPLTTEVVAVTGLTVDVLAGHAIDMEAATQMLRSADFVAAHNAGFDRPIIERTLPGGMGRPWACSLRSCDWLARGFTGRKLGELLGAVGYFHGSHRAAADVDALIRILMIGANDGNPVLREVINEGSRETFVVRARSAPYEKKDVMKKRGYRWDADRKSWWTEVAEDGVDAETGWLEANVYSRCTPSHARPQVEKVTWWDRYAGS